MSEANRKRVAIITGGGSGIGRAIVEEFARNGVDTVIAGRRADALEETCSRLEGASGKVVPVVADITKAEDREQLVAACIEHFGTIDVLINNAGATATAPLLDYTVDDWRKVFETNVEATFFLSQAVAPVMRDHGGGRIVNIGSVYGSLGLNNTFYGSRLPWVTEGNHGPIREVAYSASKGGLLQLTRELATALGPWSITVNAVTPGMIPVAAIPMADDIRERLSASTPLGRVGLASEIAPAVFFLAGQGASFITGAELKVDGGWSIW
jgi:NAD(P)-dependent dehydrogenase (short-subunit alcohol dehydrogenase family)